MHVQLAPLPYHVAVVDALRRTAPKVWLNVTSEAGAAAADDSTRLHLLQQTVALSREKNGPIYALVDDVAAALGLGVPVELYQGPDERGLNAALFFDPGVARVVLSGPVQDVLADDELRFLFAHELAHHQLWTLAGGDYLVATRVLELLAGQGTAISPIWTARLYQLTTEVCADRVGVQIVGADAGVRLLMKARTGLKSVSSADFLAQSRELYAALGSGSRDWSHPEAHLRALALDWFAERGVACDDDLRSLLEGPLQLDELDGLRREDLSALTRRLVDAVLAPRWMRTDANLGHARLFFDDYEVPGDRDAADMPVRALTATDLAIWGDSVRDYLVAVLLDFSVVDPALEDLPLLHGHRLAEELGLGDAFEDALHGKLKRTKKAIAASLRERDARLDAADAQAEARGARDRGAPSGVQP